jgi:hypothetical protein
MNVSTVLYKKRIIYSKNAINLSIDPNIAGFVALFEKIYDGEPILIIFSVCRGRFTTPQFFYSTVIIETWFAEQF